MNTKLKTQTIGLSSSSTSSKLRVLCRRAGVPAPESSTAHIGCINARAMIALASIPPRIYRISRASQRSGQAT
jgi:hypothetical protein